VTHAEAVSRLFRLFAASDRKRMALYAEELSRYPEIVAGAAIERSVRQWTRTVVPPIGFILDRLREVQREDGTYRTANAPAAPRAERSSVAEKHHARVMRALFAEGLEWCEIVGVWMSADAARWPGPFRGDKGPKLEESERALSAVMRGELEGSARIREWRARGAKIGFDMPDAAKPGG